MTNAATNRTSSSKGAVAWLDDDIASYTEWVEALRDVGLEVTGYHRQTDLLNDLGKRRFDLIIVDERLRQGMGSKLVAQFHRKSPGTAFLFLSGFFIEEDLFAKLRTIHAEVPDIKLFALMKSTVGSVGTPDFVQTFVNPVLGYVSGNPTLLEEIGEEIGARGKTEGGFSVSFAEYRDMTQDARFLLSEQFRAARRLSIESEFSTGAVWICFFGDSGVPDIVVRKRDDIPSLLQIDREAAERGLAPFCFGLPRRVETIIPEQIHSSNDCSKDAGLRGYNFVNFEIGGNRASTHFDSGAYDAFLNGRWLADRGLIQEAVSHTTFATNIGVIFGQEESLEYFVDLETGGTVALDFQTIAVRNLETSPLAAVCMADCARGTQHICSLRKIGLMGRGLLVEHGFLWRVSKNYEIAVARP